MPELIQTYWPIILIAFAIGIAVAWFIFVATRKTSVTRETGDVLDEGAAPAQRNQALIDTPKTASEDASGVPLEASPEPAAPATAASAAPAAPAAAPPAGDDLTRVKGLGPKIAQILQAEGVTSFAEIAQWSDADIDRIDAKLGRFEGRIRRDNWVEQARLLAEGADGDFAGRFGNT